MQAPPNCIWKCEKCGKEQTGYSDDNIAQLPPKCPNCGNEMEGDPMIHNGPTPDAGFKIY